MSKKYALFAVLQVGGVIVFVAVVFLTILLAEGYRYDFGKQEVVKKGVVFFEGVREQGAVLFVDNRETYLSFPVGVEVEPGEHDFEVRKEGYFLWKKHLYVSEETFARFPEIKLFPNDESSYRASIIQPLESVKDWTASSVPGTGVFLINDKLHIAKYIFMEGQFQIRVQDLPFNFKPDVLAPLNGRNLIGLWGDKMFYYDDEVKTISFESDLRAVQLYAIGDKIFVMNDEGRIFLIKENIFSLEKRLSVAPFFKLPDIRSLKFERIQENKNFVAFLFSSSVSDGPSDAGGGELLVTDPDGKMVFKRSGASGGFLDGEKIYYTQGGNLEAYDLTGNKMLFKRETQKPVIWLSRVSNTFQFVFLTDDLNLLYCDEDEENCHAISKLDTDFIQSSSSLKTFIVVINNQFTLFDFGEHPVFPQNLFEDFVSYAVGGYLR